jgi:pimeloyl-ACP methyl ester carboxylesterase
MPATVAFAHATGFCGGVWRPVVASLAPGVESMVWDFPCHGSAPKLEHPIDWWDMGSFALAQVAGHQPPIGVGHSMGGAALVMAELKAPGTFASLLLIEPIIFPPPYQRHEGPLSALALKRKSRFESRTMAMSNFADKLPFSAWDRHAFDGYITCGLLDTPDGVQLACDPLDEAEIYRAATRHGVWDLLDQVGPPVRILAGALSDTHPVEFVRRLSSRFPDCDYEIVAGTGHFLPMEMPEVVVEEIRRMDGRLTG